MQRAIRPTSATLNGHRGEVAAHFEANGRYILTACWDKTAILWDTASGEKLRTVAGHTETVFDAELSPDGAEVLTASLDMTARLWHAGTGAERYRLAVHTGPVHDAIFSPDGRSLLTGSSDGTVRLWALDKLRERDTFAAQRGLIFGLALSPDGRQLLTGSADMTAILWGVASGSQLRTFQLSNRANNVAFSPDGTLALIAPAYGGAPQVFDLQTGEEVLRLGEDNTVSSPAMPMRPSPAPSSPPMAAAW